MATTNRRTPAKTGDDWLYKRIEELEAKVDRILNRAYPTVPVYDWTNPPQDPVEGQVARFINAPAASPSSLTAGSVGPTELASTTVTPGTYGDATHVGQFTVDVDGRLTAASSITITGGGTGNVATDLIFDAKGDLPVGTGSDTAAKLSVGADDTIPVADSSQTTGIRWGSIDGGGA